MQGEERKSGLFKRLKVSSIHQVDQVESEGDDDDMETLQDKRHDLFGEKEEMSTILYSEGEQEVDASESILINHFEQTPVKNLKEKK